MYQERLQGSIPISRKGVAMLPDGSNLDNLKAILALCQLPNHTGRSGIYHEFEESDARVRIDQQEGETIAFFCIDEQSKKRNDTCGKCGLRDKLWGTQPGQTICDLLVYYERKTNEKIERRALCFVELKTHASDLGHGTDQVINTYQAIKDRFTIPGNCVVQAFLIAYHGSPTDEHAAYQNKLEKRFRHGNFLFNAKNDRFPDLIQ